jgi:hypothetical protein
MKNLILQIRPRHNITHLLYSAQRLYTPYCQPLPSLLHWSGWLHWPTFSPRQLLHSVIQCLHYVTTDEVPLHDDTLYVSESYDDTKLACRCHLCFSYTIRKGLLKVILKPVMDLTGTEQVRYSWLYCGSSRFESLTAGFRDFSQSLHASAGRIPSNTPVSLNSK